MAEACILYAYTISTSFQVCFPPSVVDPMLLLEYLLEIFWISSFQKKVFHGFLNLSFPFSVLHSQFWWPNLLVVSQWSFSLFSSHSFPWEERVLSCQWVMEKGEREKGAVKGSMDCEERSAGNGACSKWFLQWIQELNFLSSLTFL